MKNRQVVLDSHPQGAVVPGNFRIVDAQTAPPGEGEVLVRNDWLSLDPYMRGRMTQAKSYANSVAIGEVMLGQTVGEVLESRDARFKPGDKVLTPLGWQLNGVARGDALTPIDAARFPASYYLGILGMPGFTATSAARSSTRCSRSRRCSRGSSSAERSRTTARRSHTATATCAGSW